MSDAGSAADGIEPQERFQGKDIPTSAFAGDDGRPDPAVIYALTAWRAGTLDQYAAVGVLAQSRVFVPVVAVLDSVTENEAGQQVEKDSHMATVSVQGPNGERGLLAFTSDTALAAWSPDSRPIATAARTAAAAALDEGADVLIVDADTDHTVMLPTPALLALAQGREWLPPIADPEVQQEVAGLLGEVDTQLPVRFELNPGTDGFELRLILVVDPSADEAQVRALAAKIAETLSASQLLRARLRGGVQLALQTATPGERA